MKLNTLVNSHIIGQLYCNNVATNEIVVVQYGRVLGLNTSRSWPDVRCAGNEWTIRTVNIRVFDVDPMPTPTKRITLDIEGEQELI
jgi:hypothetical protein